MTKNTLIKLLVPAITFLCITQSYAANLKKHPSSVSNWEGFYLGAKAGSAWSKAKADTTIVSLGGYFMPGDPEQIAAAGRQRKTTAHFFGGIQAGYNWQIQRFLLGVETDLSSSASRSMEVTQGYNTIPGSAFIIHSQFSHPYLFAVALKLGYSLSDYLIYIMAGISPQKVTYAFQFEDTFPAGNAVEATQTSTGPIGKFGAGFAYKLSPKCFLSLEYIILAFRKKSVNANVAVAPALNPQPVLKHQGRLTTQAVTIGINYLF